MKFLHISDLHFGKKVYGYAMNDDQKYWIDQFLEICDEEKPNAVVVAGDVYDVSSPSAESVSLLNYFIEEIAKERQIPILIIAGNHDSGEKLAFASAILEKNNIHIVGTIQKEIKKVTLSDEFGEVDFYLLPYLFPNQVSVVLEDEEIRTYEEAMKKLLEAQNIDFSRRNVLVSHQNITQNGVEAERGGSERTVGGSGPIDYSVFDGFDYVALGHIHSSVKVGRDEVRYAGTPLCYHMNETRQDKKGPLIVAIGSKESGVNVRTREIVPLHKMRLEKGTKQELYDLFGKDTGKEEYVGIVLTDERISPENYNYFKNLLDSRGSTLMLFDSEFKSGTSVKEGKSREEIKSTSLEDLFADLFKETNASIPPTEEEYQMMKFVAEITNRSDYSKPPKEDCPDIDKIIQFAKKLGEDKS